KGLWPLDLYRWVGTVSQQHQESLSRESQKDSRKRKMLFRGLVRFTYWDGHQTHSQQAPQRSASSDSTWELRASAEAPASFKRRNNVEYVLYRAFEWNHA